MHTCLNSPSYFNDHNHSYLFQTTPLIISSSSISTSNCCCCSCCCCVTNSNYNNNNSLLRINPSSFLYNGLRQSTLIHFSPSKRLSNYGGRNSNSSVTRRTHSCNNDSGRNYYLEKLYTFNEMRKLRKGGYVCSGFGGKREGGFLSDGIDDVEILLDLLSEEVVSENVGVRERKRVEKKGARDVTSDRKSEFSGLDKKGLKCDEKVVGIRFREGEGKGRFVRKVNRGGREEGVRAREEEYERSFVGKVNREGRKEEIWLREEEDDNGRFVKKVNREGRKEGSSCSSYYSVASTGEYESDNEDVEIKHDNYFVEGESSSGYQDDRKMDRYMKSYEEDVRENVNRRWESSKDENEILKKNNLKSYYGNEEWRKKSEKKLNVESSQQQSQVSVNIEQNSQQHNEKTDRITNQSQSMKYKTLKEMSDTDNKVTELTPSTRRRYSDTGDKLVNDKRRSDLRVSRQDEYTRQSNVNLEARIREVDTKKASTSSSHEFRMKIREDSSAETSTHVEDRREEEHQNQFTTLRDSRMETQQISEISDTRITNIESNIRREKQKLHLEASSSAEKVTMDQKVDTRRKNIENKYSTSSVELVEAPTKSLETGRKTIKASSFNVDMPKEATSSYKALKLNPEPSTQEPGAHVPGKSIEDEYSTSGVELEEAPTKSMKTRRRTIKASSFNVGMPKEATNSYKALRLNPEPSSQEPSARLTGKSGSFPIATTSTAGEYQERPESSRVRQSEISHESCISSADEQQKSSSHFVGEFVEKARHELSISEVQQEKKTHEVDLASQEGEQYESKSSGEDGSGNSDQKDGGSGPSVEMWHETGASIQQPVGTDAPDSAGHAESVKGSGRSLWNIIGDVVRLRWASPRSESHTPKSGAGKGSPGQSTSSERWFSGHEPDDSNDENVKIGSKKGRKEYSNPSSSKRKVEPLVPSSSSNTNQGSSSKVMSPSLIEESSFPSAIRMRRSPVVKITSTTETDASTSGKAEEIIHKPLIQVPQIDASGSGKMVAVDQQGPVRRKLGRTDQVSKDRFDEWEEAYTVEAMQRKNDELFMREALLEAKKAADFWEVPVGAVLVQDGKVIARGYNLVEESRDSTAHAEMICIREASNNLRSWRLSGTTLYVTLEPCPMCAGAILQARIDTVVWGAPNKLLGADGSWIRLFPDGDGGNGLDKPPAPVHPFHPNMVVRRGVLSTECADVMQQFFQLRRKKKERKTEAEPPSPAPASCLPITHHRHSKFLSKMHDAFSIMFCL
uniref:tRNA(adenine(34)) deaminase, chloroplastic n=1 Tax=Erigeron canadensis TaxID=72917 RepID=UPI001CB9D699|nr:tRNA(adenine(34)) deaminase, chloroplastic [Erigeron canadensis]